MKRVWETDELLEHWALTQEEREFAAKAKTETITRGFALLLKWFQYEGRFPSHRIEVPTVVLAYLARQLNIPVERFAAYEWNGRTMERHRAQIRQHFGFREAAVPASWCTGMSRGSRPASTRRSRAAPPRKSPP